MRNTLRPDALESPSLAKLGRLVGESPGLAPEPFRPFGDASPTPSESGQASGRSNYIARRGDSRVVARTEDYDMIARRPGQAGGFGRAAPALGRRLVWVGVALMSLTLSGCAALGLPSICSPCGPVKQLGRRIFNRPVPYAVYDEPGLIGVAAPPVEVIEAPPLIEGPAMAPAPGPTLVNPPPPAEEAPPLDLRPLDNGSSSSNKPTTSHQSLRPRDDVQTARHEASPSGLNNDPLKHFVPRLEAPADLTGVPPPADEVQPAAAEPTEEAEPSPTGAVQTLPELQPTPEIEGDAEASTDPVEAAASLAPGFRSFLSVEPRLAGGSLPEPSGWSWLADQGFRTVLDLRPLQESRHEDLARINSAGLRYLALPIQDEDVGDQTVLDRFAAEISEDSARPVYFFDTEGSRAAVLWYLQRVVNQQGAPQDAARQADEIGPRDPELWARAMAFVEQVRPPATSPNAPMPPEAPVPDLDEAPVNPPIPKASLNLLDTVVAVVTPLLDGSNAADDAPAPDPPAPKPQDPHAWRSFAALAVAGLTVPLAFFGRSAVSQVARVCHRASLPPGPPPPKSLPDESDA